MQQHIDGLFIFPSLKHVKLLSRNALTHWGKWGGIMANIYRWDCIKASYLSVLVTKLKAGQLKYILMIHNCLEEEAQWRNAGMISPSAMTLVLLNRDSGGLWIVNTVSWCLGHRNKFYFAESLPEKMLSSTKIASVDRRDHISDDSIQFLHLLTFFSKILSGLICDPISRS